MTANQVLLQKKYARIIEAYSRKYDVSLDLAMDIFYKSSLYQLVHEGISDLHCMSDDYLVEELYEEYSEPSRKLTRINC